MYKKVAASLITAFQLVLKKINGYVNSVLGIVTQLKYLFNKPDKLVRARKTIFCLFWNTLKKNENSKDELYEIAAEPKYLNKSSNLWKMTDIRPAREDIQHPRTSRWERKHNFEKRSHQGMISSSVTLDSNLPSKMFARIVVIFIQEREISHVLFQTTLTITRVYELP